MKSYLNLIPISAKVHKRKNRMTQICIFLAVFLVTGIFSMADMEVQSQRIRTIKEYGNWHVCLRNITEEDAQLIKLRPDVKAASWYNALNYRLTEDYLIEGKRVCVCGMEEALFGGILTEDLLAGNFPEEGEALMMANAKNSLGVEMGDIVVLTSPSGIENTYRISGFIETTPMAARVDGIVLCMPVKSFQELYQREKQEEITEADMVYYVRLQDHINLRNAIEDIKEQYHLAAEEAGENTALLGVSGFSEDQAMLALYSAAAVLFILVLLAGTLMIAASMNSNIAQRTEFFGMLHCIGADRKQTMRFVRLEALYWCRAAIPAGVSAGIVTTWALCAVLRFFSTAFFEDMPVLGVSAGGIVMGIVTGLLTVIIAARSPARAAARVSPLTAVSGNVWNTQSMKRAADIRMVKIETALGIHHAGQNKRNLFLMTGSFAVSIILFLSFSSLWDFMGHAVTPIRPYTPDFSIVSRDEACSIPKELVKELYQIEGVKRVYGRQFGYNIRAESASGVKNVMLISYEALQFNWADEENWASDKIGLEKTAKDTEEGLVLAVYSENNSWQQGEKIETELGELTITGFLEHCPFDGPIGTEILVCSEALFTKLTEETGYTIIDIQTGWKTGEDTAEAVRELAGEEFLFSDNRPSNQSAKGAYYSFAVFVYGFLAVIAVIAAFNIINSISMSVSARLKQYGAMRAVGMEMRQIRKMLYAETCTYAAGGIIAGILLGFPIHWLLWNQLIYARWNAAWEMPLKELFVIVLLSGISCIIAVRGPAKRIEEMDVVEVTADY